MPFNSASDEMNLNLKPNSSSGSFWEPGNFRTVVKRVDDIAKTCADLTSCIQQRSDIEKTYSKNLRDWSRKWNDILDKGSEYGSTMEAWKEVLNTAENISICHTEFRVNIASILINEIKKWKSSTLHKSIIAGYKESKQIEDDFRKAQKPWHKCYDKINKFKKEYHHHKKLENNLVAYAENCKDSTNLSEEQKIKISEKAKKATNDSELSLDKYNNALDELNKMNPKYMEDMSDVYKKSDQLEESRLNFLKNILEKFVDYDIVKSECYAEAYMSTKEKLSDIDIPSDIREWSNQKGMNMEMEWPTFKEYEPDMASTSKKSHSEKVATIKNYVEQKPSVKISDSQKDEIFTDNKSRDADTSDETIDTVSNKIENTDDLQIKRVVAMYDFEATEDDEITLHTGDEFEMVRDADEKGWCTGKKEGKIGFFPKGYVKVVGS